MSIFVWLLNRVQLLFLALTTTAALFGLFREAVALGGNSNEENDDTEMRTVPKITFNELDNGYRGIWYHIGSTDDEYKYKYSGGLGTYCDYHSPFAVYCPEAKKTFFCYGGAPAEDNQRLHHMVSYFDHESGTVPRPTLLLDKRTGDAHDNPVLSVDKQGFIWIFSTAHGLSRPAYIHRSQKPYDIGKFDLISAQRRDGAAKKSLDNFSYFQVFHDPNHGFQAIFTRYHYPAKRTSCFMSSPDGVQWSEWKRLAAVEEGHYQIGAVSHGKVATMSNFHPEGKGLDWRTNLYYMESPDRGETWQSVDGKPIDVPLTTAKNAALVRDFQSEELLVYTKDLQFDGKGRPVLVYSTSRGHRPGPANDPRTLYVTRWTGSQWTFNPVTTSDHNYDSASLYLEEDQWRIISPTDPGPQPYGTGGEMVMWTSSDQGATWTKSKQLTSGSLRNHTFARRPINAHPDFYALWADGDARRPSESSLYFCNKDGDVFRLPRFMEGDQAKPKKLSTGQATASVPR